MKCTKCDKDATHIVPDDLCALHWAEWFAKGDDSGTLKRSPRLLCNPTEPSLDVCKFVLKEIDSRTKTGQTYGEMLASKIEDLHEFMVFWRKHFIETMNPQHMPPNWDINKCAIS